MKSISDAREWQNAQHPATVPDHHSPSHLRRANPSLPQVPPSMVVCKVDAAWDALIGNCGTGGIFAGGNRHPCLDPIRDSRRLISSALMAEALVIRSAVMHAASSNVKSLMIQSDSLSLVKLLNEKGSQPTLFGILFDIYYFSSLFDVVSFVFIPRLSNVEADFLAKSAPLIV